MKDTKSHLPALVIGELINSLETNDWNDAVELALSYFKSAIGAQRAILWQLKGDRLVVMNEELGGSQPTRGTSLRASESQKIIMSILAEETEYEPFRITSANADLFKAITDVTPSGPNRILSLLRSSGVFIGFVLLDFELALDADTNNVLHKTCQLLSTLMHQQLQKTRFCSDYKDAAVIALIQKAFLHRAHRTKWEVASEVSEMIAKRLGFESFDIYLKEANDSLVRNFKEGLSLQDQNHPVVQAFLLQRPKIVERQLAANQKSKQSRTEELYAFPLIANHKTLGVLTLEHPGATLDATEREIASTLIGEFSEALATITD